tara:strand:- start:884 stop:1051 length:168 start_codon:yes stop_codon:yes gene_type:complete
MDDIKSYYTEMKKIQERAIIGLVSVAIAYIDRGDIDDARDTLMGLINTIEGQVKA